MWAPPIIFMYTWSDEGGVEVAVSGPSVPDSAPSRFLRLFRLPPVLRHPNWKSVLRLPMAPGVQGMGPPTLLLLPWYGGEVRTLPSPRSLTGL